LRQVTALHSVPNRIRSALTCSERSLARENGLMRPSRPGPWGFAVLLPILRARTLRTVTLIGVSYAAIHQSYATLFARSVSRRKYGCASRPHQAPRSVSRTNTFQTVSVSRLGGRDPSRRSRPSLPQTHQKAIPSARERHLFQWWDDVRGVDHWRRVRRR
jgi:hypothetical protein